jgi:glucokinase
MTKQGRLKNRGEDGLSPVKDPIAIGIDLGGTNIKALAVTPVGRVVAEAVVATDNPAGSGWIANTRAAFRKVEQEAGRTIIAIGVAAPGLPSRDQLSIASMPGRLPGLEGLVWKKVLACRQPVPVVNDAHAALLGEAWLGAARKSRNALLLTLGTGVGGAAIVDGSLLRGHIGRAGHFGHISLDPAGPLDIANTPGSLEDAVGECTLKRRSNGRFSSTADLVAAWRGGDREARHVWVRSVVALAAGVASLINVLDPEVVVLGGGIANAGPILFLPLTKALAKFEWCPGGARARIVAAQLGDRAGAFGAAWNALKQSEKL